MKNLDDLKDLARDAKENIDFYSDLYKDIEIDEIESREEFQEKIPSISKDRMIKYYEDGSFDLDSENIESPLLGRPTSGTTSEMACYYRTKKEIDDHVQRFIEATSHYFNAGKNKDRVLIATTFSLAPILTRQFLEKGVMVTSASPFDIERTVETFISMECNTLVCSPPVALKISERLEERGYEGLEKYYFVSSGVSSLTESRFKELFPESEIMLQYGLAETGILMKQCKNLKGENSYHLFSSEKPFDYEFLKENGEEAEEEEIGEIVITKFSKNTPLIRYKVGDLFKVGNTCECGERTYEFIGRKEDKFKLKGVTIFNDRLEEALEPVEHLVKQYQIIIDEIEDEEGPKPKIYIRTELKENSDEIRNKIAETFSESFQVAEDYNWKKGVDMDLFAPVEVENVEFKERKFRQVKDERYK
ncbi:MAG: phenylacetate-coenzyme A ligase PaaK-like adenylate-forming protein [Candidatus Nanohaloarchaea archaeon]|jgi:phenylacetate-coenzyme A ligase PaaK-like adenylate-forming protein